MWWKEQCDQIEKLDKQGRIDLMHQKVKELSKRTRNVGTPKDRPTIDIPLSHSLSL